MKFMMVMLLLGSNAFAEGYDCAIHRYLDSGVVTKEFRYENVGSVQDVKNIDVTASIYEDDSGRVALRLGDKTSYAASTLFDNPNRFLLVLGGQNSAMLDCEKF